MNNRIISNVLTISQLNTDSLVMVLRFYANHESLEFSHM